MDNAPTIILFWLFIIAIFLLMVASMIMAVVLIKKGKEKMLLIGKACLALSTICSIPIILVVGYILYIYIE